MKEWFKYEFGYVNIDSENLFLTNTGNWSETKELLEKTRKVSNFNRKFSVIGFIIIAYSIYCLLNFLYHLGGYATISLIVFIVGLGYRVYQYLKTEIGAKFKIPLEKITKINIIDKNIEINFIDGEGQKAIYNLNNVDEKAKNIINSIKNLKTL